MGIQAVSYTHLEKKEREAFTEDEAVEFLREKLGSKSNLFLEVQNSQERDGKSGYMIKAGEMMEDHVAVSYTHLISICTGKRY